MASDFFDKLRNQIAGGEVREALTQARAYTKGSLPAMLNEAVLHTGSLARIEKEERLGLVTREEAKVDVARLGSRVLDFIGALENKASASQMPTPPVRDPVQLVAMPDDAGLEKIIGANNLKRMDWLRLGLEASRAVCRITTPFNLGTGFMLPGGWMLTNHHVIPTKEVAAHSFIEFNVEETASGQLTVPVRAELKADTVRVDAGLDCCCCQVTALPGGPPLESWGHLVIEAAKVPQKGEHVTIIQHPAGGPKQIALTANQVVNLHEFRLQYATDTMPGSSGSPVFNDDWKVVALHHKGGNLVADATGGKIYANEGILISYIEARLGL